MDGLGASETGQQGRQTLVKGQGTSTGDFDPVEGMRILSEDLTEVLPSGHDGMGWLAQAGRVPDRLPGRRRQVGPDVPGDRRGPLLGAR